MSAPTKRELEHLLRAGGLSRGQAKALLARGYSGLPDAADDEPDARALDTVIELAHKLKARLDEMETR